MNDFASINELIVATTNQGKLRELRQLLGPHEVKVRGLDDFPAVPEPEETGATFAANAREKALYYGGRLGGWVLADDSGLEIDALEGEPGVRSARYAGVDGDRVQRDRANNEKVLAALAAVPDERRSARFRCALCLCRDRQVRLEVEGVCEGVIGRAPRGDNGFGYDPIFYLPQLGCAIAELPPERKNAVSHRGRALRKLVETLWP